MIVTDLFRPLIVTEAVAAPAASEFEIPINKRFINPATGRPYLPSELRAEREQEIADEISKAQQAAAAAAATPAATTNSATFNASNVMKLPGMEKYAKKPAPVTTPNFAGPTDYSKTTTSFKSPTAAPAASAAAPTVPSLTSSPAKVKPLAATTPTTAPAVATSALPGKEPQGPGGRGSVVWTQAGRDAAASPGNGVTSGGPAKTPVASKPEPVSIGGQRINPGDPLYDKIVQNVPAGSFTAANPPPYLAAAEKTAIKNIADKAVNMLRTAQSKDDLAKVKAYIDREFAKQGNKYMSEAMFFHRDRLMERAVQIFQRRIF